MSYRCEPCGQHCMGVMRRHVVRRANGTTAREVPVCAGCQTELDHGVKLAQISARFTPKTVVQSSNGSNGAHGAQVSPEEKVHPTPRATPQRMTPKKRRIADLFDDDRR